MFCLSSYDYNVRVLHRGPQLPWIPSLLSFGHLHERGRYFCFTVACEATPDIVTDTFVDPEAQRSPLHPCGAPESTGLPLDLVIELVVPTIIGPYLAIC